MDTEILVENRIVDGQKLIRELSRSGFDVSVAFWVRLSESDVWILYIGSRSISPDKPGEEYTILYSCLNHVPDVSIGLSEIYVIPFSDPIARAAIAIRDRNRKRIPARYEGKRLGNLDIEEAWIYPERFPWLVRFGPNGHWQVLVSEAEDLWLDCQSEEEARAIAAAPVLEHQVLSQFFQWGAEEAEKSEDGRA